MAASAINFQPTKIRAGSTGYLWGNVALPPANGRITLAATADGIKTPDAVSNPNAKLLGLTREGATFKIVPSFENFMADEYANPVKTSMSGLEGTIDAEFLEVFNMDLLKVLSAGFGTFGTGSGYDEIAFGIGIQAYTSLALIFPTEADPTKFAVAQLYKAFNQSGLDSLGGSRKTMSGLKASFRGLDIPSRASADTLGKFWVETAA